MKSSDLWCTFKYTEWTRKRLTLKRITKFLSANLVRHTSLLSLRHTHIPWKVRRRDDGRFWMLEQSKKDKTTFKKICFVYFNLVDKCCARFQRTIIILHFKNFTRGMHVLSVWAWESFLVNLSLGNKIITEERRLSEALSLTRSRV